MCTVCVCVCEHVHLNCLHVVVNVKTFCGQRRWRHLRSGRSCGRPRWGSAPSTYQPPWGGQRLWRCILGRPTCTAWLMPRCSLGGGGGREGGDGEIERERGRFTHAATDARPSSLAPTKHRVTQVEGMLSGAPPWFSCTICVLLHSGGGSSGKTVHPTFMAAKQAGATWNFKRFVLMETRAGGCCRGILLRDPF